MTFVLGTTDSPLLHTPPEGAAATSTVSAGSQNHESAEIPVGHLGRYRALDGSRGAPLYLDFDGPHAILVVGKRGYGKSYTLGVIAEELARTVGIAPVVVDPMGVFRTLAEPSEGTPVPATVVETPRIDPASLDPRSWCPLLDLSPESGAGGLVWQAAAERTTLDGMCEHITDSDAPIRDRRAATNHLHLADSWGVFDTDGLDASALGGEEVTVLDVSAADRAAMNAIVRGVTEELYRARIEGRTSRLPWLLLDEAHAFFGDVAGPALETVLTRGRAPGVSLVAATQRPGVLPEVAISQSDILVSHRLTAESDLDALEAVRPTYLGTSLSERMPTDPGEVVIVDDATESVHTAQVRVRETPHGGDSPSVSDRQLGEFPGSDHD